MRQLKGLFVGAVAAAVLLTTGCESKPGRPQVESQGMNGSGQSMRGSSDNLQNPETPAPSDLDRGTGGAGSSTGVGGTGTGDVQGSSSDGLGTGTMDSHPAGSSTGTGTEGSDMGSGGATNSAQDQGTPPR